jgi:flavin-dependent dehydrogenase
VARYEIVVAGAGVAGAVAALTAARLGRCTALIDAPAQRPPGEALAEDAAIVLRGLGLGDLLDQPDHVRCREVIFVGATAPARHPWPGFILDRKKFGSDLLAAALAAGCERFCGEMVAITHAGAGNDFTLDIKTNSGAVKIRATTVIDATGRNAVVARRIGAVRKVITNLAGSWTVLPTKRVAGKPGTLAVEAVGANWCYLAIGGRVTAAAILGRRPPKDVTSWLTMARCTRLFDLLVPPIQVRPIIYPANVSVLDPVCGERWLACGDAAATFDPLSGYGLAFAIGSGYAAARSANTLLRGDPLATRAFGQFVADRVGRAWAGLAEAYQSLAMADSRAVSVSSG